ncbi:hypothetical protein L208DRAFT_1408608 [Tricholoma matsutake]|nr:hypothetical protein L208DRAFT_1408608 [Tricholoma matsutake 945]
MYANINLDAFKCIIINHFCMGVCHHSSMNRGSYACVFLFTLENNFQVVRRVVLPVREMVKTEAEVVAWKYVDLAMVMSSFLLPELHKDDSNTGHYALWYPLDSHPLCEATTFTQNIQFYYPNQVPASLCGPFDSEFDFLKVPNNKLDCWAFNKVFEVYCTIWHLYRDKTFHFSRGDLSSWNILVDPHSGMITSVINWEMAGFHPTWLAAIAGGWFNDDQDHHHLKYGDDNLGDAELHSHFCLQLVGQNMEFPEVRVIFYACYIWLARYEKHEWDLRLH